MGKIKRLTDIKSLRHRRLRMLRRNMEGRVHKEGGCFKRMGANAGLFDHLATSSGGEKVELQAESPPCGTSSFEVFESCSSEPCHMTPPSTCSEDEQFSSEWESWRVEDKDLDELLAEHPLSDDEDDGDDENLESYTSTKKDLEEEFQQKLRDWHKKYAVTNVALCALLCILQSHPCFNFLPRSDKTFLQTSTNLKYDKVHPGLYHHIGLELILRKILNCLNEKVSRFKLFVGIDGLPMFKSVPGEIWAILISFIGNPSLKKVVCPIGLWYGPGKPESIDLYLKEFVTEATTLIKNGIQLGKSKVDVSICGFGCDAPAKSFILNTKGHAGYYSCTKCKAEGEYFNNRVTFPVDKPIKMRTHADFVKQSDSEYHNGSTPLLKLPGINFLNHFPLDYLHLVCLGILRTIVYVWIFGKPPYKLRHRLIDSFSKNLEFLKSFVPDEFNRKGRTMNEVRRWKGTEFRTLLLYTGIIALKDLEVDFPDAYFHFLTLHVIMRILLSKKPSKPLREYAEKLIAQFLSQSQNLYGQQIMTHNFHNLLHLPDNLNNFDNLEECSTFKFENCLGSLKKLKRKAAKVLQQCCLRLHEYLINNQWFHNAPQMEEPAPFKLFRKHNDGPVPRNILGQQYKSVKMPHFKITSSTPENCVLLEDKSIVIVRNIIATADSEVIIVGQKVKKFENFYPPPLIDSTLLGIGYVDELGCLEYWPASKVSQKMMLLPYKDTHVCIPLLHGDLD